LSTGQAVLGNADHPGSNRVLTGSVVSAMNHHGAAEDAVLSAGELKSRYDSLHADIAVVVRSHGAQVTQGLLALLCLLTLLCAIRALRAGLLSGDGLLLRIHSWIEAFADPFGIHASEIAELMNANGIQLLGLQTTHFSDHTGTLGFPVKLDRPANVIVSGDTKNSGNETSILLLLLLPGLLLLPCLLLLRTLLLPPCLLLLLGLLLLARLLLTLLLLGLLLLACLLLALLLLRLLLRLLLLPPLRLLLLLGSLLRPPLLLPLLPLLLACLELLLLVRPSLRI
jgi:hypothetical protein